MPTLEEVEQLLGLFGSEEERLPPELERASRGITGPMSIGFTPPVEQDRPRYTLPQIIEAGLTGQKLEGLPGRKILSEEEDFLRGLIRSAEYPSRMFLDPQVREIAPQKEVKPVVPKNLDPDTLDTIADALGEAAPVVAGGVMAPGYLVGPVAGAIQGAAEEAVTSGGARIAEGDIAGGLGQVGLGAGVGAAFGGLGVVGKKVLNKFTSEAIQQANIKPLPLALMHLQEDTEIAMARAARSGGDFDEAFQRELTALQSRRRGVIPPERALVPTGKAASPDVADVDLTAVSDAIDTTHKTLNNIELLRNPLKFSSAELEAIQTEARRLESRPFSPVATGKYTNKPTSQQFMWDSLTRKALRAAGLSPTEQNIILNQLDPWERVILGRSYEKGSSEAATKVARALRAEARKYGTSTFGEQLHASLAKTLRDTNTARSPWTGQEGFFTIGELSENAVEPVKKNMGKFISDLKRKTHLDGTAVWYTSMLSSFGTLVRNGVGNLVEGIGETGVRTLRGAASLDPRQIGAQFFGIWNGMEKAGKNFAEAWRTGLIEEVRRGNMEAIAELTGAAKEPVTGLAKYVKVFPRVMAATDDFFTTLGFYADLYDQAYRATNKLSGKARTDAAERLIRNPTDKMTQKAMEAGRRSVFRDTPVGITHTKILKGLETFQRIPFAGRLFLPFVRTPLNLGKRAMEYSPLGFGIALARGAQQGADEGIKSALRASIGSAAAIGTYALAATGNLTGRWEHLSDGEKTTRYAKGERPMSVKVGNKWISYDNLGPITAMFNLGASTWEEAQATGKPMAAIVQSIPTETMIGAMESTFIPQFWELFSGFVKPDEYGEEVIQSIINSLTNLVAPRPLQDLARVIDPTIRERTVDPGKILGPKIPGVTKYEPESAALPRLGLFGEELKRGGILTENYSLIDILSPSRAESITQDRLILEIDRLQRALPENKDARVTAPGFNASSAGMSTKQFDTAYTDQEVFAVRKAKGHLQRRFMEEVLRNSGYEQWDDVIKARVLKKRYERAGSIINKTVRAFKQNNRPISEAEILRAIGIK